MKTFDDKNTNSDSVLVDKITISIDGKHIEVNPDDKNIVDVATRAKIGIPAPCYRNDRKNGCCNACVVDINGEQKFACSTPPADGMEIIVNREDLKDIRKQRLLDYAIGKTTESSCGCSCSTNSSDCC